MHFRTSLCSLASVNENKVAQSIMKLVEYRKLQDMIVEVQIPTEQVREITDGKEGDYRFFKVTVDMP